MWRDTGKGTPVGRGGKRFGKGHYDGETRERTWESANGWGFTGMDTQIVMVSIFTY